MRKVSVVHEIMSMQHVWNNANRETRIIGEKSSPLPLYSREIPSVLAGDFVLDSAMRGRRKAWYRFNGVNKE
jgi:hypothetical protein